MVLTDSETVAGYTYRERIDRLRARKLRQSREKVEHYGYLDQDDHGDVVAPDDFHWTLTPNHPNGGCYGFAGLGSNFRSLLEAHPTYVDPDDALAGRYMTTLAAYDKGPWPQEFATGHLLRDQQRYGIIGGIGAGQHFSPDYRIGLSLGWGGLLRKVRHYRRLHGPDKRPFYQAEEDVILGMQDWIGRTVDAIQRELERETRPDRRENLRRMRDANAWIVENPPRTFHEACQWTSWSAMGGRMYNLDGAGGQLDELLRPYYQRDVAAGRLDDEQAVFLLACLLLAEPKYYQLGGRSPDGADLTSRVSTLILEAAHLLNLTCNLTVRVHEDMDEKFFEQSVRYLVEDRKAWPRFAGDKGLVEGFMRNGYSAEIARQRCATGCHWFAIPGREYTLNDIVKINCARVLEIALWEMLDDSQAPRGVAALWERFSEHLRRAVACAAEGLDIHMAHQKDVRPEVFLDLMCYGTIEQGLDVTDGGVEFVNLCVDGCGLGTVADSFAAMAQRIEREGVLTWEALAEHLYKNFAGPEGRRVRQMLLNSERYGQGGSSGDAWAVRLSRLFTRLVKERPTPDGHNMIPGWFSWSLTAVMGRCVWATPDGRTGGAPISHGANPNPGFRQDGAPTAMVRAIADVQPGYGNAAPVQMELDPGIARGETGFASVLSLIRTHFRLGGTLFNINVFDKDKVLDAHKDPSKHPDLVVRVTGFSALFASLSPGFRQLVVDRILAE